MKDVLGADVSTLVSEEGWKVLKEEHQITYGVVRFYTSSGKLDPNGPANLVNAYKAGLKWVDIYHFPDHRVDPKKQVRDTLLALENTRIDVWRYWIDVEPGGHWPHDPKSNATFLEALVHAYEVAVGSRVGIYTAGWAWSGIMANTPAFAHLPLWYAHYDAKANFSDFSKQGRVYGWTQPSMKQFRGNVPIFEGSPRSGLFDANWLPGDSPLVPPVFRTPSEPDRVHVVNQAA